MTNIYHIMSQIRTCYDDWSVMTWEPIRSLESKLEQKNPQYFGCSLIWTIVKWIPGLKTWWRHQMETFSALLAICAENSPVPGEFPAQRPVTRSFDVFFDLRLNKRLSQHSWGWWFETLSWSLWRHHNVKWIHGLIIQGISHTNSRFYMVPITMELSVKRPSLHWWSWRLRVTSK